MAFPLAHFSLGCGIATAFGQRIHSPGKALFWLTLSILPDFDFFFVAALGLGLRQYHRTFTHSFTFTLVASLAAFFVGKRAGWVTVWRDWLVIYLVLLSHLFLDFFCVASVARHGETLLWPFSREPFGYESFLVPLYRRFGGEPNSLQVAIPYTLLELVLWSPVTVWILITNSCPKNSC
ncbi:MAG TPA: metal-dependent hydrolase [Acidobacteriota bacterium]|jgi:membrane-bound metal-dependent hydrolase YbcI (DUF457 family)